jgi:hypothetical protein
MISKTKSRSIALTLIAMILVPIASVHAAPDYFFSASDDWTMRKWIFNSTTSENTAVNFPGAVYSMALGNGGQTVYSGAQSSYVYSVFANDATTLAAGSEYTGATDAMDNLIVVNDTLLCANWGA